MRTVLIIGLLALSCAVVASAQQRALEIVDPNVEDVNPFAVSTRVIPVDLRTPSSFEHVYRSADGDGFLRISGAIVAEFFRGEYVRTQFGTIPVAPAGTVFYIGARDGQLTVNETEAHTSPLMVRSRVSNRLDGSVAQNRAGAQVSNRVFDRAADQPPTDRPTVWTDEAYRQARMRTSIERALRGAESR